MKREAKFQTVFNHWLKEKHGQTFVYKLPDCGFQSPFDVFSLDKNGEFTAWELKQTQTDSLPFSAVAPHQLLALEATGGRVVIKYPKFFCIIGITTWMQESFSSKRRSLTSARAKELSTFIVDL